jgi:thiol-disulfide isomerase/thioredoxin
MIPVFSRRAAAFVLVALAFTPGTSLVAQQKTPRPARALIDEGVSRAAASGKNVMVKFSASWCIPCKQLDRFLADTSVGAIIRSHYEIVGLVALETPDMVAQENPGGAEWAKSVGGDLTAMGFPFFVILDATGKKIGDSNLMPITGNIGFPAEIEEVAEFDGLLQRTAPRITVAERAKIKIYLDRAAGRITP